MKQYLDFKMPHNNKLKNNKILYAFTVLAIFFAFLFIPIYYSSAETAEEIKNKIDQKNTDINNLEQEIKQYQTQLNGLSKQKNSLAGSIAELDLNRKKLNADISLTQNKIDKTNLTIDSLSTDIGSKENSITSATSAIALDIKRKDEFEQKTLVEVLLSDSDFTNVWNDLDQMAVVESRIRQNIKELRTVKGQLEGTRTETIVAKEELTSLKAKLSDQRKIIEQNTAEKNKLLSQTKNSEANYQKLLKEQLALRNAIEQEILDFESQLKFILNPSALPVGRVLSWPLDSILVTSSFGPRGGRIHAGTDFRASVGTPVKSVADGVVLGTGNTDLSCPKASFGQWVLVEQNNGLSSVYAHLSLIKTKTGDKVSRGEIIAYTGNSGSSTGPHLHLGVYATRDTDGNKGIEVQTIPSKSCFGKILTQPIGANNARLDPMIYLPNSTASMFKSTAQKE